ncbi:ABC transporter ATP-binding protein [Corynebacterium renale]|uniref:ABC-2 type transport system ATP-binding protein n=1 Tax=Corynebacterium renale TaxID=1724 RepID=A0A2A9DMF3_9CORY|nr:ABC-2 type transport system ATP-binding protein [Corynebacterium renale]SQG63353.1 ABC transporter ATP-binding protein [Corynebacterium renale]SQI21715.1 ABC transporter ATP-binding protein [Corynebacterium renale]STC99689.1 ABC transporter ATP-binding protein [Corynebacterium renale]
MGGGTRVSQPIVAARDVRQSFGATPVLHGVSFAVHPGEVIAILGPNGAGKTTLIDVLLGLTRPAAGTLQVFGTTPRAAVRSGHVGAILQTGGLLPDITVEDTVRMIAATHPNPRPIAEVLDDTRLTPIAKRRISRCSGGEKQRVKFALALLADPQLIIFDEPTTGMDPAARSAFWQDIDARAQQGTTIIFTTHYLEEAEQYARRILFLNAGRIIADGPTKQVLRAAGGNVVEFELHDPAELDGWGLNPQRTGENTYKVRAVDSDAVARQLLTRTSASNVTITPTSLNDVFRALAEDKG